MLILTRRLGESIVMGKDYETEITILGTQRNQVKLGVNAPKDVPVHRSEIADRIKAGLLPEKKENKYASQ